MNSGSSRHQNSDKQSKKRSPGQARILRNWSISQRLSLWYSLTILLLLITFASITYAEFHQSIHADFDQHLKHETSLLQPYVELKEGAPEFESIELWNSTAYQTTGIYATYVRLLMRDGVPIASSPNFENLAALELKLPDVAEETTISSDWGDSPLRTLFNPVRDSLGNLAGWLEVSGIEWAVHQQLASLVRIYLLGIVISTILAFGGGYLLARRALRPVEEITQAAKEIRASNLKARLPSRKDVNDELTRLVETINNLLERLNDSVVREQRFISNATHELLTPLTTLRGELDLAQRLEKEPDTKTSLNVAISDIDRMEQIIRSLLLLARAEKLESSPRTEFDLLELCREHIGRFSDRADELGVTVELEEGAPSEISADPVHAGTIIDNLLDNALKYTPEGGSVRIQVHCTNNIVKLIVADTGMGFDSSTSERMFDRFYRANRSEIQNQSGSGLGLAIARAIARAYGGDIHGFSRGLGQGSTFEVEFPQGDRIRNA